MKHPKMSLPNWCTAASQHFRKLMRNMLREMEQQMASLREVVGTTFSTILQDTLAAKDFNTMQVEKEIQVAEATAQQQELAGELQRARYEIYMLAEFEITFRIKLYGNIIVFRMSQREASKVELQELVVRFDYPPEIPLTERPEPDFDSDEFQTKKRPVFDTKLLDIFRYKLEPEYIDLQAFHERVFKICPCHNQIHDNILKLSGELGVYVNNLIPKWIEAEAAEGKRRKERLPAPEVIGAANHLGERLIKLYKDEVFVEARRFMMSLCHAMNKDLDMAEASAVYRNRIPSDKTLPNLLAEAAERVKNTQNFTRTCDLEADLERCFDWIVWAHGLVKKNLVMLIGKRDQTAMEELLGYEVHTLAELEVEARDVLTYYQMAVLEEDSEAAQLEELENEELDRIHTKLAMVLDELDKEEEAFQAAEASKDRLRYIVTRETNKLKNSIRELDFFLVDFMDVTRMEKLPDFIEYPMRSWRSWAMSFINNEAKKLFKDAYARQVKRWDKVLLPEEQDLLRTIEDGMTQVYERHCGIIVRFMANMMAKVHEQLPIVDTDDHDLNKAMMDMNTKVAYIKKSPWIAMDEFSDVWYAIEATHKRMKELIFLEKEKFGKTNLENFLGVVLVPGSEVTQGLHPTEYVVEENLGINAMHPLPPSPPKPEPISLIPEQPPPKLTLKEKREWEKIALEKEEKKGRKLAAEANKGKQLRKRMDPDTLAVVKEKQETIARQEAEAKACRRAKEKKDAKMAALDLERRLKLAELSARRTRDVAKFGCKTRIEGEEPKVYGRRMGPLVKPKKEIKVADVNAVTQKIFEKVKTKSSISERLQPDELLRLQHQAEIEAEGRRLGKELYESFEIKEWGIRLAEKKAKEFVEKYNRWKVQREEDRVKAEAAREALLKRIQEESAAKAEREFERNVQISEAALRKRQAAKMVSKPTASDRRPRRPGPKPAKKPTQEIDTVEELGKKRKAWR